MTHEHGKWEVLTVGVEGEQGRGEQQGKGGTIVTEQQ